MKIVQTRDGSFTCFSEEYKELYHARNGALEEAFKKYIEPCEIKDNYKKVMKETADRKAAEAAAAPATPEAAAPVTAKKEEKKDNKKDVKKK